MADQNIDLKQCTTALIGRNLKLKEGVGPKTLYGLFLNSPYFNVHFRQTSKEFMTFNCGGTWRHCLLNGSIDPSNFRNRLCNVAVSK